MEPSKITIPGRDHTSAVFQVLPDSAMLSWFFNEQEHIDAACSEPQRVDGVATGMVFRGMGSPLFH